MIKSFTGRCGSINCCAGLKVLGRPLVTLVVQKMAPVSRRDKEAIGRAAKLMRLMLHDLHATLEANQAADELAGQRELVPLAGPAAAETLPGMNPHPVDIPAAFAESTTSAHTRRKVQRMLDYIQEHYAGPIQLNDLAAAAKMNASYLCSLFSRATGMTFHHYLEDLRLARAKELLRDPTLRVGEVAGAVGYSNPNHFRNVFKTRFGVPPSTWRADASPPAARPPA